MHVCVCAHVHVSTCMPVRIAQVAVPDTVSFAGKEVGPLIQSGPGVCGGEGMGGSLLDSGDSSCGDGVCFGKG